MDGPRRRCRSRATGGASCRSPGRLLIRSYSPSLSPFEVRHDCIHTSAPALLEVRPLGGHDNAPLQIDYPEGTSSPVAHLLPHIGPSLLRIAPERAAELEALTDGVTLRITESAHFICQASPQWRLIQISTRVVELVWASSYAYWTYYSTVVAGQTLAGTEVDLASYSKLQPALHLLTWAVAERTKRLA